MIGGNLNFTWSACEICGSKTKMDPLCNYCVEMMGVANLVDMVPAPLVPTWCNRRMGLARLVKRLDIFLVCESLLQNIDKYRTWVDMERFSNHHPIYLELELGGKRQRSPFKFNHGWLKMTGFKELITKVWNDFGYPQSLSPMDKLTEKLSRLKYEVRLWDKAQGKT